MTEVQSELDLAELRYIFDNSDTYTSAREWAYWWRANKRLFRPSRELWLEEATP